MISESGRGPEVDASENLFRAILYPQWWARQRNRPSSAAFDDEVFSVDIASRTTSAETLSRFRAGSGLVQFNCGEARKLGFDTRDEPDPQYPQNVAHAHVYFDGTRSQRKKRARQLADACEILEEPDFGNPQA